MAIRVVVFDLDDTLIVEEEVARSSLRATAALLPELDPRALEEAVLRQARALWRASPHNPLCRALGIASWEALWSDFSDCHASLDGVRSWAPVYREEAWSAALAGLGVDDPSLTSAMSDAYIEHQRSGHPLIDGAASAVQRTAAGARLALLTNGPTDIQRLKFRQTGLDEWFDSVVISGAVGMGKPDPAVFRLVLDELGVGPDQAVMVGDNWERDVRGALNVGMAAVWISDGRPVPTPGPAVTVIRSVADLPEVLLTSS